MKLEEKTKKDTLEKKTKTEHKLKSNETSSSISTLFS